MSDELQSKPANGRCKWLLEQIQLTGLSVRNPPAELPQLPAMSRTGPEAPIEATHLMSAPTAAIAQSASVVVSSIDAARSMQVSRGVQLPFDDGNRASGQAAGFSTFFTYGTCGDDLKACRTEEDMHTSVVPGDSADTGTSASGVRTHARSGYDSISINASFPNSSDDVSAMEIDSGLLPTQWSPDPESAVQEWGARTTPGLVLIPYSIPQPGGYTGLQNNVLDGPPPALSVFGSPLESCPVCHASIRLCTCTDFERDASLDPPP